MPFADETGEADDGLVLNPITRADFRSAVVGTQVLQINTVRHHPDMRCARAAGLHLAAQDFRYRQRQIRFSPLMAFAKARETLQRQARFATALQYQWRVDLD